MSIRDTVIPGAPQGKTLGDVVERERRTDLGERPIMKVVPVGRAGMWGNKVPECKLRWWYGPTKDGQTTNRHARRAAASRARRGLPCT